MRLLVLSELARVADSLLPIVQPAGFEVSHAKTIEEAVGTCAPAAASAVILHSAVADARLAEKVSRLGALGFRPVFAALDAQSEEWEERTLLAGAAFIFHTPWRADLLLSRLRGAANEPPGVSAKRAEIEKAPPRPSSNPPFASDGTMWGANPLLSKLHEVAQLYRHASQPDAFATAFLDRIREALALNRIALYLAPEDGGRTLVCAYVAGIEAKRWRMATLSLDAGVGKWMAEHLVAISIGTIERYGIDREIRDEMNALGAFSAIPVQGGDEFMGVLLVGSRVTGYPLTNDEIELVYLLSLELGRTLKAGRLNKALGTERQFLADLMEGLGSGCAVFDREFRAIHVNKRLVETCGGGVPLEFNFRSLPKVLASLAFEVSTGARSEAETLFTDGRGGTHLAKVSLFNPQSRAILILVDDVTRLTADHTRELISLERELVTRLGSQFVHEVRNSLTRLVTLGQILPKSRKDPAFLDQLEKVLPKDLDRLLRHATILEILSKPTPEMRSLINAGEAILGAWSEVCRDYPAFSSEWFDASAVYGNEAAVYANAAVFKRTCFELLLNAAQSVEAAATKKLTVRIDAATGSTYRLSFEDSGGGFGADILPIAVSPFVTTRNQGLGLGLTLAEKFARESGGSLSIGQSAKLGGGSVVLSLPDHG